MSAMTVENLLWGTTICVTSSMAVDHLFWGTADGIKSAMALQPIDRRKKNILVEHLLHQEVCYLQNRL